MFQVLNSAMADDPQKLGKSFWSFHLSLLKSAATEAYGATDALLTFLAVVLFFLGLVNQELAHKGNVPSVPAFCPFLPFYRAN
jgi:hypothetical protein